MSPAQHQECRKLLDADEFRWGAPPTIVRALLDDVRDRDERIRVLEVALLAARAWADPNRVAKHTKTEVLALINRALSPENAEKKSEQL